MVWCGGRAAQSQTERRGAALEPLGEHHIDNCPLSAGDVIVAAIAARTNRIHLGSAVTALTSDDPIRVVQRYSTLNAIPNGRAEVSLLDGEVVAWVSDHR
jgi:alkanesulfonate monooxygenase SsuD/methylene tetrahydromethanopterin reductase-like flavin-dependent oxidoreductase (luciferase family)